jgi:hypothetical protein
MRSQLFGFAVDMHMLYEADLNCPLMQAHQVTVQFIRQSGLLIGMSGALPQVTSLLPCYAMGIETWLTPMSPEVEQITSDIVRKYGLSDEMERMKLLKEALDWRWLKFRETAVVAQIYLATTIDERVHLSIQVGWNNGAPLDSKATSLYFVKGYFVHLKQLHFMDKWRTVYPLEIEPTKAAAKPRAYGIRPDTYERLRKLHEIREKERRKGNIVTTRLAACDAVGIAMSTVKKYDKMLHDRWYDAAYQPPT